MDFKNQIIQEYLTQGCGFRKLAAKYGISRTTICKWVAIYQGIHNMAPTEKQQKYYISAMNSSKKKATDEQQQTFDALQQKITSLEKMLQWEKLRADALDTMINIAEKQLNVSIRKKSGNQQSEK
jgi:transposase-like protein